MLRTLEKYFHPFIGRILFWNAVMLVFVKLVFPQSAFQVASIVNNIPLFDSREIITLTNETRQSQNLPALKTNSLLDVAANEKLEDMAIKEYFAHTSPEGVTPWFWLKKNNYQYTVAGENLAIGFFTAKETIQAWMNSPSHKANILNNKYKEIGVAVKGVEIGEHRGILIVQMFGSSVPTVQTTQPVNISANPNPTPTATPQLAILTTTPTVSSIPQAQGESTNAISTDIAVQPVEQPVSVQFKDADNVMKWSERLNRVYVVYALIVALLSVFTLFLFERSKINALKISFNFALFILAVLVPVYQLTFKGFVF